MKTCTRCLEAKPETEFYLDRGALRGQCKVCVRTVRARYGQAHREQTKSAGLRYRQSLVGKAKRTAWLKRRAQTEQHKAYGREWAKTEKGKAGRRSRVNRYAVTPNGVAARRRKVARRRASMQIENTLTAEEWGEILAQHNYACAYCGAAFTKEAPATQDHVMPISRGGHHTRVNVIPACRRCNSSKWTNDKPRS